MAATHRVRCRNAAANAGNEAAGPPPRPPRLKENPVLYTIAVVLVILWLLGLVTSYTIGGFIHVLLVIAIVVVLLRVISGRSPI